jgi:tetratricopeptide (TPR) repeat protein
MLAPLRDYLTPKDPGSSPLLCTTKEHYFSRLSVEVYPGKPGYDEARWITSEDTNVEHLLDIFTSVDASSNEVWDACYYFMEHLSNHKPRVVALGSKIKGLPDDHPSKPKCLSRLAWLFDDVGNNMESKQLLTHALKLQRERGNELWVAETLRGVSNSNRLLGLGKEGIQQLKEALEIYERLGDVSGQACSLCSLVYSLQCDGQLDVAEGHALQVIDRFSGKGEQYSVCKCYRALGSIYRLKGETEKATDHLNTALGIASPFNWDDQLFSIHRELAWVSFNQGKFDDAHTHIEHAKSHAANDIYLLAWAVGLQGRFWLGQGRFEEARSAVSHAADVFERLGATNKANVCRAILRDIEEAEEK